MAMNESSFLQGIEKLRLFNEPIAEVMTSNEMLMDVENHYPALKSPANYIELPTKPFQAYRRSYSADRYRFIKHPICKPIPLSEELSMLVLDETIASTSSSSSNPKFLPRSHAVCTDFDENAHSEVSNSSFD